MSLDAVRPNGETTPTARRFVLISNHGLELLRAAIAGEGLAFLPVWGVESALADGRLQEVTLDDARLVPSRQTDMSVYLLYPHEKAQLGRVKVLADFLGAELGA